MERPELINSHEYKFTKRQLEVANGKYPDKLDQRDAFVDGSDWAFEWCRRNPAWRRYKDIQPERFNTSTHEPVEYIVALDTGLVTHLWWNGDMFCNYYWDEADEEYSLSTAYDAQVVGWIEMPKPPKFIDDENQD